MRGTSLGFDRTKARLGLRTDVDDDAGTGDGDQSRVRSLIGEHRHEDDRQTGRERAVGRTRPSVAQDHRGEGEDESLAGPTTRRTRSTAAHPAGAGRNCLPGRHQYPGVQARHGLDRELKGRAGRSRDPRPPSQTSSKSRVQLPSAQRPGSATSAATSSSR